LQFEKNAIKITRRKDDINNEELMKKITILLVTIFVLSALFATEQQLLLDAACKISCVVNISEVDNDQGSPSYVREYRDFYVNFLGLTRAEIEEKTTSVALAEICQEKFGIADSSGRRDCWYVKH